MEKASSRLRVLALLVVVMFIALSTRLWFLQVLAAQRFEQESVDNAVRFEYTDALRGQIYDSTGKKLLVENVESLEVRITPSELGNQGEAVVLRVAALTGEDPATIARKLQDKRYLPTQAIPVAEFVPKEAQFYVAENPRKFPGVEVGPTAIRSYGYGSLAAHILGYTGLIQADQYDTWGKKQGYGLNDTVGQAGVEAVYERYLRGEPGKQKLIVNADGETIKTLGSIPPTPGDDLVLALNERVQKAAQQALVDGMAQARGQTVTSGYLKANAGSVIVMDANTGGIVAMVTEPTFDPSWYVHGLTPAQKKYLYKNPNAPSFNRAIQATYTPGSTFKPITGLAAVKEGIASLSSSYECGATYTKAGDESGTVFNNWTTANLGYMSIGEALRISCDTVFDAFGGAFYDRYVQNSIGEHADLLEKDLHEWGFEQPTGIDLPAESTGLVPDPAWASEPEQKSLFPYGWVPGGDILTMIGSGYVQVTPIQLAQAYAAIANGGRLCRPHVVDEILGANGAVVKRISGRCEKTLPYTAAQLAYIRSALRSAVTSGTAACAFSGFPMSQITVAGKTGTAERPPAQDTSWFASMVGPDPEHPEYVVVTSVEQGGFGGQTAAPITRRVIAALYPELNDTAYPSCAVKDQ